VTSKNNSKNNQEPFIVEIKINDYLNAYLKCKVVALHKNKLWEQFAAFNKTIRVEKSKRSKN